jgi:hypothetical protein
MHSKGSVLEFNTGKGVVAFMPALFRSPFVHHCACEIILKL